MRPGISYQYNANGQITSITENNKTNFYEYDGLGRLTRENDEDRNVTICYNYDSNGNILSKVFYPYSTGTLSSATSTISYTYSSTWGDQLLTYNGGSTITYDAIGNPLSYNGYTFTWQKGRQLASANDGTNSYQFIYNADGQRTWKTKNNSSTQYTYASGLLNPLRYRGYFYDTDLGFYLLETRYYDPETGRFINADGVLDARSANGANLYEYCLNNPINAEDTNGKKPKWLAAAVSNAVVSALSQGIKTYKANRSQKGAFKTALKAAAKAEVNPFC